MAIIESYMELIRSFLAYDLTACEFEQQYLELFKTDNERRVESVYNILDKLFADVDAFCADPELRDEDDIDEDELRRKCKDALEKLAN